MFPVFLVCLKIYLSVRWLIPTSYWSGQMGGNTKGALAPLTAKTFTIFFRWIWNLNHKISFPLKFIFVNPTTNNPTKTAVFTNNSTTIAFIEETSRRSCAFCIFRVLVYLTPKPIGKLNWENSFLISKIYHPHSQQTMFPRDIDTHPQVRIQYIYKKRRPCNLQSLLSNHYNILQF